MKNIEIKVAVKSFKDIIASLKKIGACYKGKIKQIDTYYNNQKGRLKIREINKKEAELIFYQRPNRKGLKISDYQRTKLDIKSLNSLKKNLNQTLGESIIVKKTRDLWIYKNTRIHIDKVENLGNFVELETVINDNKYNKFEKEYKKVLNALSLMSFTIQSHSYSDLLMKSLGSKNHHLIKLHPKSAGLI